MTTALCWTPIHASSPETQTCSTSGGQQCSATIPDKDIGGVVSSFAVERCDSILDVNVWLNVEHP